MIQFILQNDPSFMPNAEPKPGMFSQTYLLMFQFAIAVQNVLLHAFNCLNVLHSLCQ